MLRDPKIHQAKEKSENVFGNKSHSWELKANCLYKYIEERSREEERNKEDRKIHELLTMTKYKTNHYSTG